MRRRLVALVAAVVAMAAQSRDMTVRARFCDGCNATPLLQSAVDAVAASGGGTVTVTPGEYVVASLRLRSDVTLKLERNATLLGSTNKADYAAYRNEGDTLASVVHAEGATNVAVVGEGVVDGRGRLHERKVTSTSSGLRLEPGRNILYFHRCGGVRVEGVTLRCGSSWSCHFRDCDGVVARRVRIWSHCNRSNDGFDIESRNVLIEDCDVDTEDDALVVKAREPESVVEDVVVRRCRLSSNAEHVKIGTETLGTIRRILVEDCDLACRTPMSHAQPWSRLRIPGLNTVQCALSAISLFLMDGGSVEDVTIRNISIGEGIMTPVCIRYGDRKPRRLKGKGFFRNVTIENVTMSAPSASAVACSVAGLPQMRPENVVFRNLDLVFKGGGRAADAVEKIVDEHPSDYPTPYHVFCSMLPAYGFYLRHADGVRFENVRMRVMDLDEKRPPIVADDADYSASRCDFFGIFP